MLRALNNGARIGSLDEITLKAAILVVAKVIRQQLAKQARFHENHGAYYANDVCKSMTHYLPGKTGATGSGPANGIAVTGQTLTARVGNARIGVRERARVKGEGVKE
jgi:hypothetical protein